MTPARLLGSERERARLARCKSIVKTWIQRQHRESHQSLLRRNASQPDVSSDADRWGLDRHSSALDDHV